MSGAEERMAAVLAEHDDYDLRVMDSEATPGCASWWSICACGERSETQATTWHLTHVAAALVAAGFGDVAAAKAEALREAADEMPDVRDLTCNGSVIGTVHDWLRDRADEIEADHA